MIAHDWVIFPAAILNPLGTLFKLPILDA